MISFNFKLMKTTQLIALGPMLFTDSATDWKGVNPKVAFWKPYVGPQETDPDVVDPNDPLAPFLELTGSSRFFNDVRIVESIQKEMTDRDRRITSRWLNADDYHNLHDSAIDLQLDPLKNYDSNGNVRRISKEQIEAAETQEANDNDEH